MNELVLKPSSCLMKWKGLTHKSYTTGFNHSPFPWRGQLSWLEIKLKRKFIDVDPESFPAEGALADSGI